MNFQVSKTKLLWIGGTVLVTVGLFFFLKPVFAGTRVLAQTFSIGSFQLHYYGLILAAAAFAGWVVALRRTQQYGLKAERGEYIIFISLLAGLLGARLYHVATAWNYYSSHIDQIFAFWNGGLGIYGGVLGGGLALAFFAWRDKEVGQRWITRFVAYLNWLTFSLLIGQIIGRFGNLFNYEVYGLPTNLPWKMFVPVLFRMREHLLDAFYHPWFLYESLLNVLIFAFLWRYKRTSPVLFLWYLLLYTIVRLLLEFLRLESQFVGPVRLNVLVSGIAAIISAALIYYGNSRLSQNNQRTR